MFLVGRIVSEGAILSSGRAGAGDLQTRRHGLKVPPGLCGSGELSELDLSSAEAPRRLLKKSEYAYPDGVCRRIEGFSKPLSILLIVYALVAGVLTLLASYGLADPRMFDETAIATADIETEGILFLVVSVFFLLAIAERVLFFTCAFFVGRFTFRAMKNLYTVGSVVPDKSPSATIYWYIVPFANFVVPASAMSEIYRGSIEETGQIHTSSLVSYWWTAWLVSLFGSIVANSRFTPIEVLGPAIVIGMGFSLVAALLLRQLIRRIASAQQVILHSGAAQVFA